jgi:hypothetical protein
MTASKFEKSSKTHKVWFNKSPKNAQSLVFGFSGCPLAPPSTARLEKNTKVKKVLKNAKS